MEFLKNEKFYVTLNLFVFFESCYMTRKNVDDQFVKQHISLYKRIGDDYRVRNVLRMFIILKKDNSAYEIYTEAGNGIIGKYSLRNDTLTMFHEYEFVISDSIVEMSKLNEIDTIPEFYPRKFIVRKNSLIDITNYEIFPEYPNKFARKRENYILIK